MGQQNDTGGPAATLPPNQSLDAATERPPDYLSIFSPPGVEVVLRWWAESNRRWTERNGANSLILPAAIRPEAQ